MLGLNSPLAADCLASSKSLALAANIRSFAANNASCIVSRAAFLADVGRVASRRDEIFAARAACSGESFVRDIAQSDWNFSGYYGRPFEIMKGVYLVADECSWI